MSQHRTGVRAAMVSCAICACAGLAQHTLAQGAAATTERADAVAAASESARGVAGVVEVAFSGGVLRAKPVRDAMAPMLVRVSQSGPDRFRVEYLGLVSGTYDLAELIERDDGRPATGLGAIPVSIATQLPPNHGTDVFGLQAPDFGLSAHYRTLLMLGGATWLLVPAAMIARRLLNRPRAVVAPPFVPEPTARELLSDMVKTSRTRELTLAERGRLELLLLRALREEAGSTAGGVTGSASGLAIAIAIAELRSDARTEPLVKSIEEWLHAGESGQTRDRGAAAMAALDHYRLNPAPSAGGRS